MGGVRWSVHTHRFAGSLRRHAGTVGVAGALLVFVGISAIYALAAPPFFGVDEPAHLGYAHAVADGQIPSIDDVPAPPPSATEWQASVDRNAGTYRGTIWVANHPPLHYVFVTPLIWMAEALDLADGGLLFMRLANIGAATVGLVFTYLLVRESGGSQRVALIAASIVAFLPAGHEQFALALNDGTAFAAGTMLVWAAVRCVKGDRSSRGLFMLGTTAALASGARTSSMVLAVVLVGLVAVIVQHSERRTSSPGSRMRLAAHIAAVGLGPSAVLFGWFYIRNLVEYGDIAASDHLLELQGYEHRGLIDASTSADTWRNAFAGLTSNVIEDYFGQRVAGTNALVVGVFALAAIGTVVSLRVPAVETGGDQRPCTVSPRALVVNVAAVAVVIVTLLAFVADGGPAYPRYLFPALGSLAAVTAIGLDRMLPRWGGLAVVGLLALRAWQLAPTNVTDAMLAAMPPGLRHHATGAAPRMLVLVLAVAGTSLLLLLLCVGALLTPRRTATVGPADPPPTLHP